MTAPLDEKGLAAGIAVFKEKHGWAGMPAGFPDAIRAYLSAVALPDELEVVAWRSKVTVGDDWSFTPFDPTCDTTDFHAVEMLVRADQAHSTIAALRAEIEQMTWQLDASQTTALMLNGVIDRCRKDASSAEAEVKRLTEEKEALRDLAERLKLEAQGHASEAKTANSTIYEIYQVLSGGKGEPGNWHGAEPARRYVEAAEARIKALEEALRPFANKPDDWTVDQVNAARAVLNSREKGE